MPVLANARHERFAQELAKGATADEAYQLAGYAANRGNASTLKANQNIEARVTEILTRAAKRVEITVHDIADQLDEDRKFARELEAPGAAISATMGKAKVLGLIVDKAETKTDATVKVEMADTELARLMVFHLTKASKTPAPGA